MLIYDNNLKRYVWITEADFDVTQISPDYSLEEETQEWLDDFEKYKLEQAVETTTELIEELQQEEATEEIVIEKQAELEEYIEKLAE